MAKKSAVINVAVLGDAKKLKKALDDGSTSIGNFTKGGMSGASVLSHFKGSRGAFYESTYNPQTKTVTDKEGKSNFSHISFH